MHEHDEHCGCGCGHDHTHDHHLELTEGQRAFLHELERHHYLPVARFLVESSTSAEYSNVALVPVYLRAADEDIGGVKETGALILALEKAGYLTLDYDFPLEGYAYTEYHNSALYAYFCQTVAEGKIQGYQGDTPRLELGSIAPANTIN